MNLNQNKVKIVFMGSLFALMIAGLVYVMSIPRPVIVEVAQVSRGLFQETIRSDGILQSKEHYIVPAFTEGGIKRVALRVGDPIKKNEKITELLWDAKYVPVLSPINGVISKVFRESAGPIRRGEPIVEVIDPSNLEVMAELLTTDAMRLKTGAMAWIENWPGGKTLEAKVVRISKAGFTKQSALGVEEERTQVTAELLNIPPEVFERAGSTFHVDVLFQINETKNAIKVPVGSLIRDGSQWAVYLAEKGRAHKVNVEVGALSEKEALINSGLQVGQEVLVYPGDLVKEGTRIRPEKTKE